MADQIVEMRERRLFGWSLQGVEATSPELIALQKLVQLATLLLSQLHEHGVEQSPVNHGSDMSGELVERAKCGQLEALPYQLYQRSAKWPA